MNNNMVVIIPMNEFGKENIELLNKAVESVPNELNVLLSIPKEVNKKELKGANDRLGVVSESEGSSFAELVNAAVSTIEEKWFSILEFDDTYTPIWYDNAKKYIEFMPNISVFMYLEDITDFNDGKYIGFGNEAAWASAFSNEIGFIDNDCLQNYFDFYLTGSIFNTADWREIGGLKPSIKITFWYEWLLRATNKNKTVYVIPKVGYNHKLGRKGSLIETYKSTIGQEETQWWFDLAKRESLFHPSIERDPNKFIFNDKSEDTEE
jgi:hypothetical protein